MDMGSTRSSKTAGEVADAGAVPSQNPAEASVASEGVEAPADMVDDAFADMEAKGEVIPEGMVRVRYTGRAHVRSFVASDFLANGINDQTDVEFNVGNRWTVAVSPAAADFLVAMPLEGFAKVPDDEEMVDEPAVQLVPALGVEPGTGGVAIAMAPTPDSA
jgi:hypothetical protein